MKKKVVISLVLLMLGVAAYGTMGFYTIQPIGAVPEGATWLVWRNSGEPFFNSADSASLSRTGSVSLLSRGFALRDAPKERIIAKLSYWRFAYMQSTGNREFSH